MDLQKKQDADDIWNNHLRPSIYTGRMFDPKKVTLLLRKLFGRVL
jgi:hypothetical protein